MRQHSRYTEKTNRNLFFLLIIGTTLSLTIFFGLSIFKIGPNSTPKVEPSRQSSLQLLKQYLNQKLNLTFSVTNQTSTKSVADYTYGFYTYQRINSEINSIQFSNLQQRLNYINNTVKNHFPHSKSLFRDNIYLDHNLNSLLAFFGTGECFLSAEIFSYFSANLGLKTKVSDISGHSIAEVEYNNSWHVYDPQFLGYLPDNNGNNQDLESIKKVASQNLLPKEINPLYQAQNHVKEYPYDLKFFYDGGNIKFAYYPLETRYFTRDLMTIASDKYHQNKFANYQDYLKNYQNLVANFIREIPLSSIESNSITISEKSPILGVYLVTHHPAKLRSLSIKDSGLNGPPADGIITKINDNTSVIDYSSIITQNQDYYTNSLIVNNISKNQKIYPNSKLIIISQYSLINIDTDEFLKISRKNGLTVSTQN